MPKPSHYKSGSLIYCRGEEANKIFILQTGKVSLIHTDIETGNDVRNPLKSGDFFGVKSAIGHFPREENAIALADSTVMVFSVPEFEKLVMANPKIILKMLKVLSNQMRKNHVQVSSLAETEDEEDEEEKVKIKPDKGLFTIGVKYLKTKRYAYAEYVFDRYLALYPTGEDAKEAANNLQAAKASLAEAGSTGKEQDDNTETREEVTVEPPPPSRDSVVSRAYYDAVSLISERKYEESILAFNQIISANNEPEWTEKSSYEVGHCFLLLNKFEDCIKHYTKFLAQYPEYPDKRDAIYYMGQAYEKLGDKEKAIGAYKKIITLSGEEKDGTRTRAMKALKALEKG